MEKNIEAAASSEKVAFSLRVEKSVLEKIGRYATQDQRSMNNYIVRVLVGHIRNRERKEEKERHA